MGPSRAEVGVALALRLCQALLSSPPLRWLVFSPSSVRFFFLALSGFARRGLGVLVLVFSPLLRSPSRVPVRYFVISSSSSFHAHFYLIHPAAAECVCVPSVFIFPFEFQIFAAGGCRAQWKLHPMKLSTCAGSRV